MIDVLQARIDTLEANAAHQEHMVEELNEVVLAQRTEIERLTRRLDALVSRLATLEEQAPLPENVPPPHY